MPEELREFVFSLVEGLKCIKYVLSDVEIELNDYCEISLHDNVDEQLKVAA